MTILFLFLFLFGLLVQLSYICIEQIDTIMKKNIVSGSEVMVDGKLVELKNQRQFQEILDRQPEAKYVIPHKILKGVKTLKIGYVEALLDTFFPGWSFKPVARGQVANSVYYEGLLVVTSPVTGRKIKRSGIGAVPIEVSSRGKSPIDWENINAMAIAKNFPASRSFALKSAAKSLGKLFGRDLNRNGDTPNYDIYSIKSVSKLVSGEALQSSII